MGWPAGHESPIIRPEMRRLWLLPAFAPAALVPLYAASAEGSGIHEPDSALFLVLGVLFLAISGALLTRSPRV